MAADASIFSQYLRPVRSVAEYASDMDAREQNQIALVGARRQNELGALQLDQTRGQIADAAAKRNALQSLYADPRNSDPMARETAMLGNPLLSAEGQAARKARLDAEHLGAQTGQASAAAVKSTTEADGLKYKQRIEKANTALKDIAAFQHPGEALADLQRKTQAGELPPEQAQALAQQLQSLQTPQQWAEWQRMTRYRILDAKDQLEQEWKAKEFERNQSNAEATNANRVMIADPANPGKFIANAPYVAAEKDMRKAGASSTTVNTGQKGLDNELKVRGDFRSEPVYKAHQEMQSAYSQIQQSLKQASPAGDLAAATKMMKLLDPGSVVRESELGMAMAATGLLDRVQSFVPNIVNGTKLTPDQRKQFQSLADALFGESVNQFNAKRSEYADLGGGYGMNTDRLLGPKANGQRGTAAPRSAPGGLPDASAIDAEIARRRGGK